MDSYYIYQIRPVRPDFNDRSTAEDDKIMADHFQYLTKLLNDGKLLLAGPCLDAAFGIAIYKAESDSEAKDIMENDPSVVSGIMTAEYHPFKISLLSSS